MSLVGRLKATLGLDARGFDKGLNNSENRVQRFVKSVVRLGAAAVAGIAGVAVSIGRAADSLVELDNQAKIAGESVGKFKVLSIAAQEFGIGQEKLADILKDVNDKFGDYAATGAGPLADFFENIAPKVGVTLKSFEDLSSSDALQLYVSSLEKAGVSQQQMTFYMEALASDATALLPVLKDQGAALQSVSARAEALGLTLNQDTVDAARNAKREFGIVSEVLRTRFQAAMAGLIPLLVSLANALAPVVAAFSAAFSKIVSIAGVLAVAIGTRLAVAVGVKYVASVISATRQAIALEVALGAKSRAAAVAGVAIKGLSRALIALRSALVATGIGALVVAAGLLVDQFTHLVQRSGGLGTALSLLWNVAKEVFDRIGLAGLAAVDRLRAGFFDLQARSVRIWAGIIRTVTNAAEAIVDSGIGAAEAFKTAFQGIPHALGDFMFQAANSVIDGVEGMINAVVSRINKFISGLNSALAKLPSWAGGGSLSVGLVGEVNLGGVDNPFAGKAAGMGQAAQDAYDAAQGTSDFGGRADRLEALASGIDTSAAAARAASDVLLDMATAPLTSIDALREAMQETEGDIDSTSEATTRLQQELDKLGNGGGGGAGKGKSGKSIKEKLSEPFKYLKEKVKGFSDSLAGAIVQGKSLGDAMRGVFQRMAQDLIASGIQRLMMSLFSFGGGGGKIFGSLLGSIFKVPSYASGTMNHPGGIAQVFEEGGELINLPSGARVIPHDLSRMMVTAAGKSAGASASSDLSKVQTQEVVVRLSQSAMRLSDDGKIVAEIGLQTDQKISRAAENADRALPQKVQQINQRPRDRYT
ncbi:hypothetical protein [Phaeobacter inhibens]|uniref:Phage tail tape measure protein n=1 Tax=Phaeobacter inhibens TaxID=221822 RepID=A0A2I7KHA2_9RHOB|nr:hypothetical protein [Phaeobacter inhibens]AUR01973.1 hypothetical protein PhaeoP88_04661 [Phaeobacter inhibens]